MAQIVFYGKPNCINNNKQKKMLMAAGHVVDDRDILTTKWIPDQLREYFGQTPVAEWFNMTAPAIKSNTFSVEGLSPHEALAAMLADPILIRRPLMEINGSKVAGFRFDEIDGLIGLSPVPGCEEEMQTLRSDNITTCPFVNQDTSCDEKQT